MIFSLLIIILVSAFLYVYFDFADSKLMFIFKPATTALIIILALWQNHGISDFYGNLIIAGLIFSLIGDVFLMLPSDKFVLGLTSFLIAHIFYIIAFGWGFGPYFEIGYLIPAALYMIVFLWILLPKTGKMKFPVLVYSFVLMIFLWQATGRIYYLGNSSAYYTFAGAVLFVVSDSVLAHTRFVYSFKFSSTIIHITYWFAQILIALSI